MAEDYDARLQSIHDCLDEARDWISRGNGHHAGLALIMMLHRVVELEKRLRDDGRIVPRAPKGDGT